MTAIELLQKYPKAGEAVVKYYSDIFTKSIETTDVPEEFKDFARQQTIDEEYVAEFIDNNPRGTFDVFDAHKIYINTPVSMVDGYFRWEIKTDIETWDTSEFLDNRKMAEEAAVEKAFEILNDKLCQTK